MKNLTEAPRTFPPTVQNHTPDTVLGSLPTSSRFPVTPDAGGQMKDTGLIAIRTAYSNRFTELFRSIGQSPTRESRQEVARAALGSFLHTDNLTVDSPEISAATSYLEHLRLLAVPRGKASTTLDQQAMVRKMEEGVTNSPEEEKERYTAGLILGEVLLEQYLSHFSQDLPINDPGDSVKIDSLLAEMILKDMRIALTPKE